MTVHGNLYLILATSEVTPRLLNLSTSTGLSTAASLPNGRVVLEYAPEHAPLLLDHVWYSAEDVARIRDDMASEASPWWRFWG